MWRPAMFAARWFPDNSCALQANFVIPDDIEGERFGPLSGMTLERRVVDACLHGKLAAKPGCEDAVGVALCVTCGANGM